MINDDLGVSFNLHDTNYNLKYESIWQMAFKEYEKSKMLSEELRILYVALTRAKEKIIITGFVNNLYKNYYSQGLDTVEKIAPRYAEGSSWPAKINSFVEKIRNS